ncbi:MAG: copper resistance protein CopC, partial [Chloroflexota bacterium]|nr:copper resistance protein CopC [Chloroflexota bacterium]
MFSREIGAGHRQFRRLPPTLYGLLILCAWTIGPTDGVSAHATLARADPPVDGLLVAPPDQLSLWFTEPVAGSDPGPEVTLLDETGRAIKLGTARLDAADKRRVRATVPVLGPGTFTVSWAIRSATDGHNLAGTYAFRLGGGMAPGSATIEGETPRVWAVVTRWLTFLGVALAAGSGLFRLVLPPGFQAGSSHSRRSDWAMAIGATVALSATLAEPLLQAVIPPPRGVSPSLGEAIRGVPDAWWLRPLALAPLMLLGISTARGWRRWPLRIGVLPPLVLSAIALLGLSLTSHAAARESLKAPALMSNVLHQWSVALWVGGLIHLGLNWATDGEPHPARRFSKVALPLVAVGIATGVANAGLVLPAWSALWESTYGVALLLKIALLVVPLGLATFHRVALRRVAVGVAG